MKMFYEKDADVDLIKNKKIKPLGLISTSRTGAVAMTRGANIFN